MVKESNEVLNSIEASKSIVDQEPTTIEVQELIEIQEPFEVNKPIVAHKKQDNNSIKIEFESKQDEESEQQIPEYLL